MSCVVKLSSLVLLFPHIILLEVSLVERDMTLLSLAEDVGTASPTLTSHWEE